MDRLEKDVQVNPRLVALTFLKNTSEDRAWEAWVVRRESVGFEREARLSCAFSAGCAFHDTHLPAANDHHVRRQGNVDRRREAVDAVAAHRKPARRIEQIGSVIVDGSKFQALDRALLRRVQYTFIVEGEGG